MVSFAVQNILSLICLFLLLFPLPEAIDPKRHYYNLCQRVSCLFSSGSFMASGLIFRSVIYFEFILVYSMRKCSNFVLLHVGVHFLATFIKKAFFSPTVYFCLLHCKLTEHKCMGLFLGFLFCSIDLCVCFYATVALKF